MTFKVIQPGDMAKLAGDNHAMVIDLRDEALFAEAHYRGAVNIPFERLRQSVMGQSSLQLPKEMALVLYCEHGSASIMAARQLGSLGYTVYAVAGGFNAIKKYE